MDVESLYPYWEDTHLELVELLEWLPEAVWDYRPGLNDIRSIRQIVLHMIERERYWIVHIAREGPFGRPDPGDFRTPELLIEGLTAVRRQTMLYVASLKPMTLRTVRTIPTDADMGMPETNRPISWLLWQVAQHEIYHYGQIQARRYEALNRD